MGETSPTLYRLQKMTHVVLIDGNENEQHIQFPTPIGFTAYLDEVRKAIPDRRFQIFQSWETT